jgi:hypothetical protein
MSDADFSALQSKRRRKVDAAKVEAENGRD